MHTFRWQLYDPYAEHGTSTFQLKLPIFNTRNITPLMTTNKCITVKVG